MQQPGVPPQQGVPPLGFQQQQDLQPQQGVPPLGFQQQQGLQPQPNGCKYRHRLILACIMLIFVGIVLTYFSPPSFHNRYNMDSIVLSFLGVVLLYAVYDECYKKKKTPAN